MKRTRAADRHFYAFVVALLVATVGVAVYFSMKADGTSAPLISVETSSPKDPGSAEAGSDLVYPGDVSLPRRTVVAQQPEQGEERASAGSPPNSALKVPAYQDRPVTTRYVPARLVSSRYVSSRYVPARYVPARYVSANLVDTGSDVKSEISE
jgi:hypothetical protein